MRKFTSLLALAALSACGSPSGPLSIEAEIGLTDGCPGFDGVRYPPPDDYIDALEKAVDLDSRLEPVLENAKAHGGWDRHDQTELMTSSRRSEFRSR